jgi:hypothetical protein
MKRHEAFRFGNTEEAYRKPPLDLVYLSLFSVLAPSVTVAISFMSCHGTGYANPSNTLMYAVSFSISGN